MSASKEQMLRWHNGNARIALLSKLQDVVHYYASLCDGFAGYESTFETPTTLRAKLDRYTEARNGAILAGDLAREAGEDWPDVMDLTKHENELETVIDMRENAREALILISAFCERIQVNPWCCKDLRTGKQH